MSLRSGWIPAALTVLIGTALASYVAQIPLTDLIRFLGYLAGWIVLPGTLIWRAIGRHRAARPLAEDLAIGALVGYVVEFPVYTLGLAISHPRLYLLWPVVAVALSLVGPWRSAIWRRGDRRMPLTWSWTVSAGALYLLAWFAQQGWAKIPATNDGLSHAYVDEPFHLALATGLRYFFPPRVTYVDDTSLQYHWLSHLHVAAGSWASGVEPAVLLHSLAVPALTVACCVALAFIAARLTGTTWPGLATMAGLLVAPAMFTNWSNGDGERFLVVRLIQSPSAAFVNIALLLGLLLIIELIRDTVRGVEYWALLALTMVAMIGAKSTSLATVLGGLAVASLIALLTDRSQLRRLIPLGVLAAAMFLLGMRIFFGGGGTHGLAIDPFQLTSEKGTVDRPAAALAALGYLGFLSTAGGLLLWMRAGGWRRPDRTFLLGLCLAGMGAGLLFHQAGLSQYYFIYVTFLPMLLGGVLGLHDAVVRSERRGYDVVRVLGLAATLGTLAGLLLIAVNRTVEERPAGSGDFAHVLTNSTAPLVVTILLVAATTVAVIWLSPRIAASGTRGLRGCVAAVAVAGVGFAPTLGHATTLGTTSPVLAMAETPEVVPPGGIEAARWLRAHSGVHDLIATNAHCEIAGQTPGADPAAMPTCRTRNFWMAAYAERQFLVEGWSYVSRADDPLVDGKPLSTFVRPFWDPDRLRENDAAFNRPRPKAIEALKDRGVRWLFVDRGFPANVERLRTLKKSLKRVYQNERIVIFRVRI